MPLFESTESTYSFFNAFAFFAWLTLFIAPQSEAVRKILLNLVLLFFAVCYTYLLITTFQLESIRDFSTLKGLQALFSNEEALLAGWLHYLAFDLLAGITIAKDATKLGFSRYLIPIFLLFTFMAGPLGWLLYFAARLIKTRGTLMNA
jgi:hypothetical protein